MRRQQSQYTPFKPGDYDQPTEPLEQVFLPPPLSPAPDAPDLAPRESTVPAAQWPGYPYHQQPAGYPILPQAPLKGYRATPPGRRARRSMVPGLVGLFLFGGQMVLLARVVCVLAGVQNTAPWVTLLFATSDLFVLPVRVLAANINLSLLAGTQLLFVLELLVAIVVYGILSRLLVRLLRVLFNA
jgi:hypothetical protein